MFVHHQTHRCFFSQYFTMHCGSISLIDCTRQSFMHTRSHAHFSFVSFLTPLTSPLPPRYPSRTLFSLPFLPPPPSTHTRIFVPRDVCVACAIPCLNHLSNDAQLGLRHATAPNLKQVVSSSRFFWCGTHKPSHEQKEKTSISPSLLPLSPLSSTTTTTTTTFVVFWVILRVQRRSFWMVP